MKKNIIDRLKSIADGCDECAAECLKEFEQTNDATKKADGRAWRATSQMIRNIVTDLVGP